MTLPGLKPHRDLAKATLADAWRLEGGKVSPERMVDAWETVLRNADHLSQGATLIEQLVGMAERVLVQRNARWALQHEVFSPEELESALDVLTEHDRETSDPTLGSRREYACSMDFTRFLFSPADTEGQPRLNLERAEYIAEHVFDWTDAPDIIDSLSGMGPDGARSGTDALDRYYHELTEQMRVGYPEVRAADMRATHEEYRGISPIIELLAPDLSRVAQLRARDEASRRATQLSYATHVFKARYGCWPESLDELPAEYGTRMRTDPFTGHDFGYRLTNDGPRIYSLSENGLDDGGVHSPRWSDEITDDAGSDDHVFWPPQEGK